MIGRVSVSGDKDLMRRLNALGERVKKQHLQAALTEAAEPMRARMADLATRGKVAPHIEENIVISNASKVEGVRLHEDEAAVAIGPSKDFFYGWFLEFGTVKMAPKPFMRPAFDQEHQGALSRLGGFIWNLLKAGRGASAGFRGE